MLQQFINWFWSNEVENNTTKVECKHYAAHKIEKAYLEYKSRQRLNLQSVSYTHLTLPTKSGV